MGNWLSTESGLSSVDTVQIPSGQRDDNRRSGEETEGKGRNRTAVESYISPSNFPKTANFRPIFRLELRLKMLNNGDAHLQTTLNRHRSPAKVA